MVSLALVLSALGAGDALGLGGDHPNNRPVRGNGNWPSGMADLVNITNRVHGFFVNDVDVFFYCGSATNFTAFLQKYSQIKGIVEGHRLVLHDGVGEAKSPWGTGERPCDWELYGRGSGWKAGTITKYVLEVHFWTGGRVALDKVAVPKNVEIQPVKTSTASNTITIVNDTPLVSQPKALPNWYVFKVKQFRKITHSGDKTFAVVEGVTMGDKPFKVKVVWDQSFNHRKLLDDWTKRAQAEFEAGIPYVISGEVMSRDPLTIMDDTVVSNGDNFGAPPENVF